MMVWFCTELRRTVSIVSHLAMEDWGDVAGETGNEAAANNSLHKETHKHRQSLKQHTLDLPHPILMHTLTTALPLPCFVLSHTRHLHILAPLPTAANLYHATLLKSDNESPLLASYLDEFFSCVEFANNPVLHGRHLEVEPPPGTSVTINLQSDMRLREGGDGRGRGEEEQKVVTHYF